MSTPLRKTAIEARSRAAMCLILIAILLTLASPRDATPMTARFGTTGGVVARHPMHTSVTVITHTADGTVSASIRIFADDLGEIMGRKSGDASAELDSRAAALLSAYVAERFVVVGGDGRPIALAWCGAKRTGDLLLLCVAARGVKTLRGATVVNRILLERFRDQVNVVQVQYEGRRQSMLFSRAEAPKRLP